jgi:hypothetical protein
MLLYSPRENPLDANLIYKEAPKFKHNDILEGWSPLVKMCCAKFTNQASLKDMIESH